MPAPEGPGAPFPPTLFFVVALGVALGLHDSQPLPIVPVPDAGWRTIAGTVLVAVGMGAFWWGMITFARARTGIMLERPARQLVDRGPYRYSRNPMYVGLVATYAGIAALANTLWPLLLLPVVIALFVTFVIRREERYLHAEFGDQYADYCQRVGRWL